MRLIDADNVRPMFNSQYIATKQLIADGEKHLDNLAEGFTEADRVIWSMPTIDAVPVVRCKDCEFYRRTEEIHPGFGTCDFVEMVRQDNDLCSKGEKRVDMTGVCKWCESEVCTNADCPCAADYCPVPDTPDVCKHEDRYKLTCAEQRDEGER